MNRKKIPVGVVLTVLCTALILSGHLAAAPKYKEGDWLTKDEFFNLFELNEYIGWDLAGSRIGENMSDSGLELYPVKIKASLHEVMLGPVSTAIHLATGSESYVLNCNNLGKQILLGTEPVSISFSGGESVVPTEYGHFSYNYDITISNLTYSYNRVFSSLGSPFDAHHDTAGHVEAFGLYTTGPDGMAIGEVVVPGGQTVSAVYQGAKNVVETVGEKGASLSSLAEGVVKGGTDAVTTMMDSGIRKAATTIAGTAAGEVMGAVTDGKDITKAAADGLLKGVGNAVTGAVGDAVGDAAKSTSGKVTEKIVETALDKTVIQAVSDEVLKEKE